MSMGMDMGHEKKGGARFEVQIADNGQFKRLRQTIYGRLNRWHPCAINLADYAGLTGSQGWI